RSSERIRDSTVRRQASTCSLAARCIFLAVSCVMPITGPLVVCRTIALAKARFSKTDLHSIFIASSMRAWMRFSRSMAWMRCFSAAAACCACSRLASLCLATPTPSKGPPSRASTMTRMRLGFLSRGGRVPAVNGQDGDDQPSESGERAVNGQENDDGDAGRNGGLFQGEHGDTIVIFVINFITIEADPAIQV